jgi:hypothetical protein
MKAKQAATVATCPFGMTTIKHAREWLRESADSVAATNAHNGRDEAEVAVIRMQFRFRKGVER